MCIHLRIGKAFLVQVWMLICVKTSCCCFVLPISYSLRPRFRLQRPVAPVPVLYMVNKHADIQLIVGMAPSFFLDLCLCLSFLHCLATQVRIPCGSRQGLRTFCVSSSRGSFASSNLPVHILMYIHKILFRKSWSKVFPFFQWSRFKPRSLYMLVNIIPLSYTPSCKDNVLIYNDGYLRGWWLN